MRRSARGLATAFVVGLGGLLGSALAQPSSQGLDPASERERLSRERTAVEQTYLAEEKACYQQFVVSSCVAAAKTKRREALADIKRQETVLNNADRLQRGTSAQQRIDEAQSPERAAQREREAQQRVDQRSKTLEQADQSAERRFEQAAKSAQARDAAATKAEQAQGSAAKQAEKAAAAPAKRSAYEQKLADAERRRAEAARKQADAKKPRADGLAVPGNSAAAASSTASQPVRPATQP